MHELLYYPPDYGSSRGTHSFLSGQQRSIVLTACRGKPLSVSWLARPCGFVRSDVPCVLLRRSRHFCVRSLFPRSSSLVWAHRSYHNQLPSETTAYVAAVTPLLDSEQGEHAAVDGRRALPWRGLPCC